MQKCMDWRSVTFDWNRARAFLVTAEEGSLSAAARALGMAQPTLGRQVAALERELGVALFERTGRGLFLTPAGLELVEHARAMGEAASRVSLAASGQAQSVEGKVTVTASEVYSVYLLPPVVARLRRAHPGIEIEIVATNDLRDLRRREADIAVRNTRPSDAELIARKLRDDRGQLYATPDYLKRIGDPTASEGFSEAEFIGFPDRERMVEWLASLGFPLSARNFPVTSESHLAQWAMVKAGAGIGVITCAVGDAEPTVRRALPSLPDVVFPVWLTAHREVRTSRRVRIVFDHFAEALSAS
jgi:DNA-binding transcriptional LysR family regulator